MAHPDRVDGDDRQDLPGRDRIASLEVRYQILARRLVLGLVFVAAAVFVGVLTNRHLVRSIQHERFRSLVSTCQAQTDRHDSTVDALDSRLDQAEATASPARVRQIRESRDFTVALIDALAPPNRHCAAYARDRVNAR